MQIITLDIVSDVVCPWCYIGKRRLERALAATAAIVEIRWHPYFLNPTMPPEGMPRADYLVWKFRSAERAARLYEPIVAAGEEEAIPFAFERIQRQPNTLDAHRLILWAHQYGQAEPLVERLFAAHFTEGLDIGDRETLARLAVAGGLDPADIATHLATERDCDTVTAAAQRAGEAGVAGVPTFFIDGRLRLDGAVPPEVLMRAIHAAAEQADD